MREDNGLVVRRQPSDTKGSARFARSLTDEVPRIEPYHAIQNIRDIGARG